MGKRNILLLLVGLFCFGMASPALSGIIGLQECRRDCAREYRDCKRTETAASAVDDISCHEMREMCIDRCRNITGYVKCKEKCGDDRSCLRKCKDNFKDNVHDYRPYLKHRQK